MDAVFTIVTKNYMPQARTLGDSLQNANHKLAFFIVLADEVEGRIDLGKEKYPVIEVKDIGIDSYRDMAFKYDLVEFCTAIKPFVIEYLFDKYGYQKIIFFDPDIYVYSALDVVLDLLNDHFVVLTPHVTQFDGAESGSKPDDDYLRCGVFNLGFIALNSSPKGRELLAWWRTKTQDKGYADFSEGLYVDQKWADMIPCFDDDGVCIARHPGFNVAHWNMHQRSITKSQSGYQVNGQSLIFFHFSGYDPSCPDMISRPHGKGPVSLQGRPEYQELYRDYRERWLINQGPNDFNTYAFSKFDNGVRIYSYQRRLYRKLSENGFKYVDPFSTGPQTYYFLLKANRMLIVNQGIEGEFRKRNIAGAENKLRKIKKIMLLMKKVMGIKHYHLLLRVINSLSRPEEQAFLLETLKTNIPNQLR